MDQLSWCAHEVRRVRAAESPGRALLRRLRRGARRHLPALRRRVPGPGALLPPLRPRGRGSGRGARGGREPRAAIRRSTSPSRILSSRAALEGERKQVTVLFVDVSGSLELAAQVDPEDVHARCWTRSCACWPGCTGSKVRSTSSPVTASWRSSARRSPTRTAQRAVRAASASAGSRYRRRLERGRTQLQVRRARRRARRRRQHRQRPPDGLHGGRRHDQRRRPPAAGRGAGIDRDRRDHAPAGRRRLRHPPARGAVGARQGEPLRAWTVEAAREGRTRLDAGAHRGLTPLVGRGPSSRRSRPRSPCARRARPGRVYRRRAGDGKSRLIYEFRGRSGDAD